MDCYRGKYMSDSAVTDVITAVMVNKKFRPFEKLSLVKLLYKEFTIGNKGMCKGCGRGIEEYDD